MTNREVLSNETEAHFSRRALLQSAGVGFGWLAFSALQAQGASALRSPLASKKPHLVPRAKNVIFMFMQGGPSHIDSFDWKPELARMASRGSAGRYLEPVFSFKQHGRSGLPIAEIFPHLGQQATVALHTGSETFVRPSFGSWIVYGLGTEAQDLPGFVTIDPITEHGGAMNYGSAFLPAMYQGTRIGGGQRGIPNITNFHLTPSDQMRQMKMVQHANRRLLARAPGNPEIEGLIEAQELAFKMQASVPITLDLRREPESIRRLYGLDSRETSAFGTQCLMARRLVEKGVRFVQLTHRGWDHHNNLRKNMQSGAAQIDQPMAALIADLKQRDLLDETLVIWGGEFGRSATDQKGTRDSRGHNAAGYSMWMAGGGVKGGVRYGVTSEVGDKAVSGIIETPDLHATILHALGLDHERLTYTYSGRDFRLTNVSGKAVKGIFA
jgi:hypothetical protein